jgi:hypothetical protein
MTQSQGLSITNLDELVISPSLFNDLMNSANDCVHPIGAIYTSTVQLLRYSFWLAEQKATLPRKEYKELLSKLGWENEEKAYLKIQAAFNSFTPYDLAQVEPRTIFQIALNFKKYESVIPQMKALPQITQDKVRGFMKQCHKPRAKKEEEAPTIWRMMPDGKRACVIAPIYNQTAGVMLQEMMEAQGKSGEAITEQAIISFYNNEFKKSLQVIDVVETNSTVTETVGVKAPTEEVVETVPIEEENISSTSHTELATAPIEVPVNKYDSWDADQVVVEEDLNSETVAHELNYGVDEDSQDNWSFELKENDDDIEDYEMLTAVGATSTLKARVEKEGETRRGGEGGNSISLSPTPSLSHSPTPELAPIDQLIYTFQTAGTWQEICQALKKHEECKLEAWDALSKEERKRIIELTPPGVVKLSNAKREGLITDFRIEREDAYHVKENGCFFWDVVFEYRVDEYLARL